MISGRFMLIEPTTLILIISLAIGLATGFVMHRSDYCVTGMFRDAIMFRTPSALRALCLQIAVTMILFELLRRAGALPFYPFPLIGKPSLANLVGGIVFGVGMVLAGGCVVGTLYKMGAGSITSLFALIGLIIGSGLYPEIHPGWAAFIKATTLADVVTLPQLLAINPGVMVAVVAVPAIVHFIRWRRQQAPADASVVTGYIEPWRAGLILALLSAISYILLGMPLGISTTYTKIAAIIENLFIPEHVSRVAYFKALPLNAFHRLLDTQLLGGAGPALDSIWDIQFPLILGITFGSTLSALMLGEFAIRCNIPGRQMLTALLGGAIMGLGSRLTPGCNIWHLMGGIPILAMQSLLFLVGLPIGTWIGGKILFRLLAAQTTCSVKQGA